MAISTQSTDLLRYFSEYSKFFLEIDIQEQGVGGSYCDYIANLSYSLAEVELERELSLAKTKIAWSGGNPSPQFFPLKTSLTMTDRI